jgi:hypothetical protein
MKTWKMSLCWLFAASVAFAADPGIVSKEATGQAAVAKGGDESKAYDEALKQALRSAVEQAAGVLITADTTTLNSQLVRDQVYSRASGYVKKFDVISKKVDKGVMTVVVKADVGTADLDKDLEAVKGLIGRLHRNKLIIVTQEQAVDEKGITTKSEVLSTALTEGFKRDGWQILDEKGGSDTMKLAAGVAQGTPPIKEILKVTDADYVVYGTVNFRYHVLDFGGKDAEGRPIIFPVTAEYELQMYDVRSRDQLAKVSGKLAESEMMKANVQKQISYSRTSQDFCKLEAPRIISELRAPVIEYLRNKDVNGNDVTLNVNGLPDLDAVDDFSKSVQTLTNVKQVRANGDFDNGKMQYTVTFTGNAMDFGKALGKSKFKAKALKVTAVKNNLVEVAIAK